MQKNSPCVTLGEVRYLEVQPQQSSCFQMSGGLKPEAALSLNESNF